jgi:hypothetical protein
MRGSMAILALVLTALALTAGAQADPANYGIESVGGSLSTEQAGAHADFTDSFTLKTENFDLPALTRDVTIELPPGLLANPNAVPKCSAAQFVSTDVEEKSNATGCPQDSQVGVTHITFANSHEGTVDYIEPVFNLRPGSGEPARLGFIALKYPIVIDTELRPDYGVTAMVRGADTLATLYKTETTLWGVPADESHNSERMTPYEAAHNRGGIETETGTRPSGLAPVPYMLNPTQCESALRLSTFVDSYSEPERISGLSTFLSPPTGCSQLEFEPDLSLVPTTGAASSGSGLEAQLNFPTNGFEHDVYVPDEQRRVEVTLPEGLTVNPSQAAGLGFCSQATFEALSANSAAADGCPGDSKIGTVTAKSPLLEEEAHGSLYVAEPYRNPYGTLIALYMVLAVPERGVLVKLAGKVTLDPHSGRITTVFGEPPFEIPQLPVSSFHLHFREGARSPLVTPRACGTYAAAATFTTWGGQTVIRRPSFVIDSGCGQRPFAPEFEGGTTSNAAASYSPLGIHLVRHDADQQLSRFSTALPPGLVAKLAGTSECPDAAIGVAATKSGAAELAHPSCPPSSRIGGLQAGAGVGSSLTYVNGELYLAGPYRGAPLSVVSITPAVAGPFDLGTVVVREALRVNPESLRVQADGRDDPIPSIVAGVPLFLRDLRLSVDRPRFALNPTNCNPLFFNATAWSAEGGEASLKDRFQAADCSRLAFRPKLSLRLSGGARRAAHPSLRAVLQMPKKGANIASASVALPHSEFLDQDHIRTICTRAQFGADNCPRASVYGHAVAKTPLLDKPLRGPVYLRSSSHKLPDLVADLRGQIHVVLAGRIDSIDGGIRTTFDSVPDAQVSSFVLAMRGGKRGLLENSTDICAKRHQVTARFIGQNNKASNFAPVLQVTCDKQKSGRGK